MKKIKLILGFILVFCAAVSAQTGKDRQLADQYMNNGEFDKAVSIYEKLYDKDPMSVYGNYYYCLIELRSFDNAEKLVKKTIKKNPDNPGFLVDLGYIYFQQGDITKAKQQYDKAIKQLKPDQGIIMLLANAFISKQENDYA